MVFGYSLFLQILLYAGLSIGTFEIRLNSNDLNCRPTGIQCINVTSFTTCTSVEHLTVLNNVILHCPDGYFCDDTTNYPCTNQITTTTTSTSTTESTTTTTTTEPTTTTTTTEPTTPTTTEPTTTTAEPTTITVEPTTTTTTTTEGTTNSTAAGSTTTRKPIVPRPSGPPTCTTTGFWPAPACDQYYECVEKTSWVFWKSYEPELRTCIAGFYYDTGLKRCIGALLSDC